MIPAALAHLIKGAPTEVWSILLKNGIELVAQIGFKQSVIVGSIPSEDQFVLQKPYQVRVINIPMQDGKGGIHVNTTAQMQPFFFYLQAKEINLEPTDIWHMEPSVKKIHDAYIEQTTGIALG